ncbi:MAG: bifunctional nuclease family protein [Candidatus Aenigmatarchaeota archaeon]
MEKFIPLLTLGILTLILISYFSFASLVSFDITGYEIVNVIEVIGNNVIVGNNCTAIIAETSPERAESISLGLKGIIQERPNTHDTFSAVLRSFNITLEAVQIEGVKDNYYYSNLILRTGDKILKLDTKPSDAIAIALRMNATIYINKTLLTRMGENIC